MVFHCCRWSVFIVSLVTWLYQNYSMGGESRNPELPGNRLERWEPQWEKQSAGRHQALPWWIPHVGVGNSSLVSNPAQDVLTCCWERAEGGGMYGLSGPLSSASQPDPEAGHSAMELVGYQTSHKEIQDIYQSVYLLRRPPGLPSCGDQLRRRMICDILSSLKDWLHRCRHPTTTREDPESEEEWQPRPNRWEPYEEALRAAHQRVLDTAKALWGDIERLSRRTRGRSWTRSQTHSQRCSRSCSRSRSRCHSRAHSQSHPQSGSQSRWLRSPSGPPPGRRVTFREPEVEPNSEESMENYSSEPSVSDVEMWLE